MPSPIGVADLCCQQQFRLFVHRGPGHPRHLVGERTAATFVGRRSIIRASQSRFVPCCRAYRMTAMAPVTSNHRK